MDQIAISQFKFLKVEQLREKMPFEITADGEVIGVVKAQDFEAEMPTVKTKCPNCGLKYDAVKPDGKPFIFTLQS